MSPPPDRPLALGDVLAETVRIYGERIWAAFGLGTIVLGSFLVAALVRHDVVGVALVALVFTGVWAAASRVVRGDSFREAWAQTAVRAPVLVVVTLVVSVPLALGVFDLLLAVFSVFWTAFAGFAVPVAVLEAPEKRDTSLRRLAHAMSRSLVLAWTAYLHALGVVLVLLVVYHLVGRILARALVGFADSGGLAAFLLVQVVLAPFLFLGLAVLYFEQRARALSSPGRI